jgi:lipid II:glycine glycyltransferase (peptidoglycan interpeptide bridge formation enzyme)
MKDIRQTPKYSKYLEKIGWQVERVGKSYSFLKKLPLIGSIVKIQRPEKLSDEVIKRLSELSKKYRVFQIIIEPKSKKHGSLITKHGFRLSKSPFLPTKTIHLDLTKSAEELFNQLKKDAKYSLKRTRDIRIYAVDDTKGFRKSWKEAVGFRRWVPPRQQLDAMLTIFKEDVLFLVTPDGASGAIFLHAEDCTYYWQAFSSKKGRRGLYQYKVVWAGINWSKEKGAKVFDFEGIYDERFPNKKWEGFTHFKRSFGGHEVEYPGAFTKLTLFKK